MIYGKHRMRGGQNKFIRRIRRQMFTEACIPTFYSGLHLRLLHILLLLYFYQHRTGVFTYRMEKSDTQLEVLDLSLYHIIIYFSRYTKLGDRLFNNASV